MTNINILHKYTEKRHYEPIESLADNDKIRSINHYQYELRHRPKKAWSNVKFLLSEPSNSERLIIAAEPFDIRIPVFRYLAKKMPVTYYHTSWPYWKQEQHQPKTVWIERQREEWRNFLTHNKSVTVTHKARQSIEAFGGSAKTIPHSVDTHIFSPDKETATTDKDILYVGRLVKEKGLLELIDAVERISQKPRVRIAGSGPLEEWIKSYEGGVDIDYLGYINNKERLARLYANSDVHVLPSRKNKNWEELFGIVIIEAMASGTPTVATECVGPSEIIDDGDTGILIPDRNVNELACAIENLLNNCEEREAMGTAARHKALTHFSNQVVSRMWSELLEI